MCYSTFGRNSGLRVSELALGTGNFGTGWAGWKKQKHRWRLRDCVTGPNLSPPP
jgi:aryl-alcohol dehydrogenase-like predicted oxidoreductase